MADRSVGDDPFSPAGMELVPAPRPARTGHGGEPSRTCPRRSR
jgi:hypothetical protein